MSQSIAIVVAIANNSAIGINNQLLAHIPGDLPRFKALTTGHTVIMGRKTFDSLPKGALPNRRNIVITRDRNLKLPNCEMASSPDEALSLLGSNETAFIIGGGEIYKLFLEISNKLYITRIEKDFPEADAFFPAYDSSKYKLLNEEIVSPTEKNDFVFRYQLWERIN